jgi:hypothetical protein
LYAINAEALTMVNAVDGEKNYFRQLTAWLSAELTFKTSVITYRILCSADHNDRLV